MGMKYKPRQFQVTMNLEVINQFDEKMLIKFLEDHLFMDLNGIVAIVDPLSLKEKNES